LLQHQPLITLEVSIKENECYNDTSIGKEQA
jgi:hypothetical protein